MVNVHSTSFPPKLSQIHLALALGVAKSRPAHLSIEEWLQEIKQSITTGSRAQRYGTHEQYIDAVDIWKKTANNFQREIHELFTANMNLEKRLDRMRKEERNQRSIPIEHEVIVVATPSPTAKRKQDFVTPSHHTTKRMRVDAEERINDDEGVLKITETGSISVQHLYRIHKCYQQKWPNPTILSYHLIEASSNLANHVSTLAESLQQQQLNASLQIDRRLREQLTTTTATQAYAEIQRAVRASGRSFASLFHGLAGLWGKDTDGALRQHGAVTYSYIQAFDVLLSTITTACKLIARQQVVGSVAGSSSTSAAPPPQAPKQPRASKGKVSIETQIPQELASFICVMLAELDATRDGPHAALFEGILYQVLERTGDCLYRLTFNQKRLATIEKNITAPALSAVEAKAVRIEVKMLANILERAMKLAPFFLGSLSASTSSSVPKRRGTSASSKASMSKTPPSKALLAIAAKEKLQATLIHCMYGGEIKDAFEQNDDSDATEADKDSDYSFLERLRKPVAPAPAPKPPKVDDVDIPQWFTEEVWRMVGWDILTRVTDW